MRIAIAQIVSGADPDENLHLVEDYTRRAQRAGVALVVFPEATQRSFGHDLWDVAEPLGGGWSTAVEQLARRYRITVLAGMFTLEDSANPVSWPIAGGPEPQQGAQQNPGLHNTVIVAGEHPLQAYHKIHLFDAFSYQESETIRAGAEPVCCTVQGYTFGLATCYDLRFPQLFTGYARAGSLATVLSASWGAGEGKLEQWRILVQARALDSTQFVIAADQGDPEFSGKPAVPGHPTGVGHSMVVAPDGEILAEAGAGEELLVVDIDPERLAQVQQQLPVLRNAVSGLGGHST